MVIVLARYKKVMYPFGHIDLRARDLDAVYLFYAGILPELGFRNEWQGERAFSESSKTPITFPMPRGLLLQLRAVRK